MVRYHMTLIIRGVLQWAWLAHISIFPLDRREQPLGEQEGTEWVRKQS
jgi:hypothetical protein